ncbi:hypothetical protein WOLCODRAFT_141782 [Wolfiporia cocos MD-104 SS10]|uniref:Uncharacterized protein n=1 Tax=Wolfiporia cocos (strain MD-104) TaxID=742152 RepID=A0A2H3IVI7_WOLCO|nr:hypothetical protein WOLCODRAFT_141782 [Wolfiporia cocos MD-104 SS10]
MANTTTNRTVVSPTVRNYSASEIAGNASRFTIWEESQGCSTSQIKNMPKSFKNVAQRVFKTEACLPQEWLTSLVELESKDFMKFLRTAHKQSPSLFSPTLSASDEHCRSILYQIHNVFEIWKKVREVRGSEIKISEADYVANIIAQADAQTVSPDLGIFIPAARMSELAGDQASPYKELQLYISPSSLQYQCTPCKTLQDEAGFVIASSFMEDKNGHYRGYQDAFRQNRMATTTALRQLHALCIRAPVLGMIWWRDEVRAHVDWWVDRPGDQHVRIYSAWYPGPKLRSGNKKQRIFKWSLHKAGDILQFQQRVMEGIQHLREEVVLHKRTIAWWRRDGIPVERDENAWRRDGIPAERDENARERRKRLRSPSPPRKSKKGKR